MGKLVVLAKICQKNTQTSRVTVLSVDSLPFWARVRGAIAAEAFSVLRVVRAVTGKCWVLPDHTYTRTHLREASCLLACSLGNDVPARTSGHVVYTPRRGSKRLPTFPIPRESPAAGAPRGGRLESGRRPPSWPDCPAMLATATTPPGFPLVWSGVPTATYTMVGYDAGTLDIQVNAMQRLSTENSPEH